MLEKVISLICEELGCADNEVDEDTLIGDLVGDELEIEELAQALENEFEVELSEELGAEITVAELAEMIENNS
ncbi:MAG: acyl carrier protein [Clostridia bacterium]|nr:acyl carrier protein [Clostridia bacterium]